MPVVPRGLIGRNLLRTCDGIVRSPSCCGRHHVVVIAKREPSLLFVVDEAGKIDTIVVARGVDFRFLPLALTPIEIVRPPTSHALQRSRVVAASSVDGRITSDAFVESCTSQREESALAGTRNGELLSIPRCVLFNIVNGPDTTDDNTLVVAVVAIVHPPIPVVHQGSVEHVVVNLLVHRDGNAVNTNLQCNRTLRGRIDVTTIRTNTGTRHTQQSGITPCFRWIGLGFHRNTENAVGAPVPLNILERHLIDVDILRTTLRQEALRGVEVYFASLADGVLPIFAEVLRHDGSRLQAFRREGRAASTLIFLAIDGGFYVDPIETGLRHLAFQRQRTIFQYHSFFFDVLIHLRSSGIIHLHIIY